MADASGPIAPGGWCQDPIELYGAPARRMIGRLARRFLDQHRLTPIELLHLPKYHHLFLNTGTYLQEAVQKAALSESARGEGSVTQRVRALHALIDRAVAQASLDYRDRPPGKITPDGFAAMIEAIATTFTPELGRRAILTAMTLDLAECQGWADKIARLVELAIAATSRPARHYVDEFLAEMLDGRDALETLLAPSPDIRALIDGVIDLAQGRVPAGRDAVPVLHGFAALLVESPMLATRAALGRRLRRALAGTAPLTSGEMGVELDAVLWLRQRLTGEGETLGGVAVRDVLDQRLLAIVSPDSLHAELRTLAHPEDRLARLFDIHRKLADTAAGMQVRAAIDFVLDNEQPARRLVEDKAPPMQRLKRLADLHGEIKRALGGGAMRQLGSFEAAQAELIRQAKLFDRLDQAAKTPAERASKLIELCASGILIPGAGLEAAQQRLRKHIQDPGFAASLVGGSDDPGARAQKMADFRDKLAAIGLAG